MANTRELPKFLLDRFIEEIEYNPKLKNYIKQKQLARKGEMVKPGESFVAPVNFVPNKNYEAYKRRVDKYNREARAANADYEERAVKALEQQRKYENWQKEHDAERAAALRKHERDNLMARELKELALDEMVRRANIERIAKGVEPLNPESYTDRMFSKRYLVNKDLNDEYWKAFDLEKDSDFYVRKNPFPYKDARDEYPETPRTNVGQMVPSNQDYIYRYHTTAAKNLPYIFNSGLRTGHGGEGFGKVLVNGGRGWDKSELDDVYTAARSPEGPITGYSPYEGQATIRLKIPKKAYRKMDRLEYNPEKDDNFNEVSKFSEGEDMYDYLADKDLVSVQHGGRTDIFQESIPPKYIDEVYTSEGKWKDPWSFLKEYECDPRVDCDEWDDAISQYLDEDGEWDWNKLRKMNDRMRRRQ